jgi:PAS domain S-box-containing protein
LQFAGRLRGDAIFTFWSRNCCQCDGAGNDPFTDRVAESEGNMKILSLLPIRQKLLIVILTISGIAIFFAATFLLYFDKKDSEQALVKDLQYKSLLLERMCSHALKTGDKSSADEALFTLHIDPNITYACLLDKSEKVFAYYAKNEDEISPLFSFSNGQSYQFTEQYLHFYKYLFYQREQVGKLYIKADLAVINHETLRYFGALSVIIMGTVLIVMIIAPALNKRFISPINHLTDVMRKVTHEHDYSVRAQKTSADEFGELIELFNIMLSKIQQWNQDLLRANRISDRHKDKLKKVLALQKRVTEQLEYKRELLDILMNNVPDSIYFKDRESRFTRINKTQAKLLGLEKEEDAIGKWDIDFFTRDHALSARKEEEAIMETGKPLINYVRKVRRGDDGSYVWLSDTKVPIFNKKGEIIGTAGITRDVTKNKLVEIRQKKLLHQLEAANQELRDFAYIVSHDLKAPLRAIGSLSDWLISDHGHKLGDDGRELLDLLHSRVQRMHDLIEGVLQYSRLGRIKEDYVKLDVNKVVADAIDLISPPANIKIDIKKKLPQVYFEKTRLNQVFQNLIGNAVKFMDKPQGLVQIDCLSKNGEWQFSISDNGPGIEEKYFDKIFQIFQSLSPRDDYESTGIGLTLVKKIIEIYGGRIWVRSTVGSGSTFYFTFPKELTLENNKDHA